MGSADWALAAVAIKTVAIAAMHARLAIALGERVSVIIGISPERLRIAKEFVRIAQASARVAEAAVQTACRFGPMMSTGPSVTECGLKRKRGTLPSIPGSRL